MKNPDRFRIFPRRPRPASGAALVLTLGMLVLLSGLVLAFFLTVQTEQVASKAYEGGTDARLLADSALNLVIGQIREASTQPNLAWTSQPGLIRTFDADGQPVKSYKLYSADSLVELGSFDPAAATDLPATDPSVPDYWKKRPALWTDINAPVADLKRKNPFDGNFPMMTYPIFDGTHLKMATDLTTGTSAAPTGSLQLSLNNDGFADIEGFKVTDRYNDGGASMPVKWLYMLKDGTLVPAKASGSAGDVEVVVPAAQQLTAQGDFNSVVARIAFWTDDESAKVNINTASEGTYWDTPVGNGQPAMPDMEGWTPDKGYYPDNGSYAPTVVTQPGTPVNTLGAGTQTPAAAAVAPILATNPYDPNVFTPNDAVFEWEYMHAIGANKEYQRYPGHPATTCLSTIFGRQLMLRSSVSGSRIKMTEEIFKMIPRVSGGEYDFSSDPATPVRLRDNSSKAGTTRANTGEFLGGVPPNPSLSTTPRLTPDSERLYASVDEFLYNPNFKANATSVDQRTAWTLAEPDASGSRDKNREMLEMSSFFLTANSKSPEQNLFNLPRVSIWPLMLDPNKRTAFDKVFAFCSTVGDKSSAANLFYFTRDDCESQTADLSPRNLELLNYLGKLSSTKVPGWNLNGAASSTFAVKYGADHPQILTEIFDYIRCTNLCDVSEPDASGNYPSSYAAKTWKVAQKWNATGYQKPTKTRGSVTPIVTPSGRGMGRFATISELLFVASRKPDNTPSIPAVGWTSFAGTQGQSQDALVQFVLVPELYAVMAGYSVLGLNMRISFTDIDFTVDVLDSAGAPIAGQTGLKPFDGVTQPSLYSAGLVTDSGNGRLFDYTNGGPTGIGLLTPHAYANSTASGQTIDTPLTTEPNRFAAPPSALLVVKNARSVLKTDASAVAAKLRITAKCNAVITSPVGLSGGVPTPLNTTGEPVIQKFAFDFGTFATPMPEPLPPSHVDPYFNFTGNSSGNNQCGRRFNTDRSAFKPGTGTGGPFVYRDYRPSYPTGQYYDVCRTLVPTGNNIQGDYRIISGLADVDSSYFKPSPAATISEKDVLNRFDFMDLNSLFLDRFRGKGTEKNEFTSKFGKLAPGVSVMLDLPSKKPDGTAIDGVLNSLSTPGRLIYGDWDSGPFSVLDGALCNKSDEGNSPTVTTSGSETNTGTGGSFGSTTYYNNLTAYMGNFVSSGIPPSQAENEGMEPGGLFSPNRQIASAVSFGSLPTGVKRIQPWQTLLFRPAKYFLPGGDGSSDIAVRHPGSAKYGPPDHLLLDFFWMPVVEPYPISEPFSTSGKVNLNQQIVPFTNIRRDTALRSVLKSVKIAALNPNQQVSPGCTGPTMTNQYKMTGIPLVQQNGAATTARVGGVISRRSIDLDNTLKQITDRLDQNKPFISASEICDIPLIPKDVPLVSVPTMLAMKQHVSAMFAPSTPLAQFDSKLATFWAAHKLTGDNLLERPYAAIYPRLTTRSNSYTVHVRVQTLPQKPGNKSFILKAAQNRAIGEFRGSYVLDRYLDPNTAGIYDVTDTTFTTKVTGNIIPGQHVLGPYRFRVVSSKQFDP